MKYSKQYAPNGLEALVFTFALALLVAGPAWAQAIPDDIPDAPEGLDDKTERQLEERHHELLSRLFSVTQTGLVAQRAEPGWGALVYESFGLMLKRDRSLALGIGVQQPRVLSIAAGPEDCVRPGNDCYQTTLLLAAQYELPLRQITGAEVLPGRADRYRLGIGLGLRSGPVDAMRLGITPQYLIPVNRYWTLGLGATAGVDAISAMAGLRPFIGAQVAVKVFPWGRRLDVLR